MLRTVRVIALPDLDNGFAGGILTIAQDAATAQPLTMSPNLKGSRDGVTRYSHQGLLSPGQVWQISGFVSDTQTVRILDWLRVQARVEVQDLYAEVEATGRILASPSLERRIKIVDPPTDSQNPLDWSERIQVSILIESVAMGGAIPVARFQGTTRPPIVAVGIPDQPIDNRIFDTRRRRDNLIGISDGVDPFVINPVVDADRLEGISGGVDPFVLRGPLRRTDRLLGQSGGIDGSRFLDAFISVADLLLGSSGGLNIVGTAEGFLIVSDVLTGQSSGLDPFRLIEPLTFADILAGESNGTDTLELRDPIRMADILTGQSEGIDEFGLQDKIQFAADILGGESDGLDTSILRGPLERADILAGESGGIDTTILRGPLERADVLVGDSFLFDAVRFESTQLLINFAINPEGSIVDRSGFNRLLTVEDIIGLVPGQFGDGGDFAAGRILVGNFLNLNLPSDFTIEFWINGEGEGSIWDKRAFIVDECPVPCGSPSTSLLPTLAKTIKKGVATQI